MPLAGSLAMLPISSFSSDPCDAGLVLPILLGAALVGLCALSLGA
jgi:hypothetical protein